MKKKKMSTWFKLPVNCMPSSIGGWMEHVNFGVRGLSSHHCEAIDDAINNHDRLTQENQRLREALMSVIQCDKINTGCEPSISCFHRSIDEAKQLLTELKGGEDE